MERTSTVLISIFMLFSTTNCNGMAAEQLPSIEVADRKSGSVEESSQILELWHTLIERSSSMRRVTQKLLQHHSSSRTRSIVAKMLDGVIESARTAQPVVAMGSSDPLSQSNFILVLNEATTLIRAYREYVVQYKERSIQLAKSEQFSSSRQKNESNYDSSRVSLLSLVGENALAKLDYELHQDAEN